MPPQRDRRSERAKSIALAVFLVAVVAYFTLTSIPSAQRPTLVRPSTSTTGTLAPSGSGSTATP